MKKSLTILVLSLLMTILSTGMVWATENQDSTQAATLTSSVYGDGTVTGEVYGNPTDEAGITPDRPFHFLERWLESLQKILTFSEEGKAQLLVKFASERLAESQVLKEKEEYQLAGETLKTYVETVTAANESAQAAVAGGKDITEVINQLAKVEGEALVVVASLADKLPPKTQQALEIALSKQEKTLAKIDAKLTQKEEKVAAIEKALEEAKASGDLARIAELEKDLAEAQLGLAEAKEFALKKLEQNQIQMVKAQLRVMKKMSQSVREDVYEEDDEKEEVTGAVYREKAKIKKEIIKAEAEARKEAIKAEAEARKEALKQVRETRKEAFKEIKEAKREAVEKGREARGEAIEEAKNDRREAIDQYREDVKEAAKKEGKESSRE